MRIPFLAKKDVIKGVKYSNTVVIRYVLPKRELLKIAAVVVILEVTTHAPVRRSWIEKAERLSDKIDDWATGNK